MLVTVEEHLAITNNKEAVEKEVYLHFLEGVQASEGAIFQNTNAVVA